MLSKVNLDLDFVKKNCIFVVQSSGNLLARVFTLFFAPKIKGNCQNLEEKRLDLVKISLGFIEIRSNVFQKEVRLVEKKPFVCAILSLLFVAER